MYTHTRTHTHTYIHTHTHTRTYTQSHNHTHTHAHTHTYTDYHLSLIHITHPTRPYKNSYAASCSKKNNTHTPHPRSHTLSHLLTSSYTNNKQDNHNKTQQPTTHNAYTAQQRTQTTNTQHPAPPFGHGHITPEELWKFPLVARPEFRICSPAVNSLPFGSVGGLYCFLETFLVSPGQIDRDRRFSTYNLGFRRDAFASIAHLINCSQPCLNI